MSDTFNLHDTMAEVLEFRQAHRGRVAHVTHPGTATALCGALTSGPAVTQGEPCVRCLDAAVTVLLVKEAQTSST
jgi:hypothetical protein